MLYPVKTQCCVSTYLVLLLLVSAAATSDEILINGDFSQGFLGWLTYADPLPFVPDVVNETCVFTENLFGDQISFLSQELVLPYSEETPYAVQFDFSNQIASTETFFASITYGAPDEISLLEFDLSGPLAVNGVISPSALGDEWLHYYGIVHISGGTEFISFGLVDHNSVQDGGVVWLDNVSLSTIPEPATVLLLGMALAGLGVKKRRQRHETARPTIVQK
jgi:hypothetical protein